MGAANDQWECSCKNCGYCKDALIEGAERIAEGSLQIVDALISPKWYEREAAGFHLDYRKNKDV
jgi:hypothetical protein